MKKLFEQLLSLRQKIVDVNWKIRRAMIKRYPYFLDIKYDVESLYFQIKNELIVLLDSSIRRKPFIIPMECRNKAGRCLTKSSGYLLKDSFRNFFGEYLAAVDIYRWLEVDQKGDLVLATPGYNRIFKFSALKNKAKFVDQTKFGKFYEYFSRVKKWVSVFSSDNFRRRLVYLEPGKKVDYISFEGKVFRINIPFETDMVPFCDELRYNQVWKLDPIELEFPTGSDLVLQKFIDKFDGFDAILRQENEFFEKLVKEGMAILKELKKENKPYKILTKLLNNHETEK